MSGKRDYYEVLGVDRGAEEGDLKRAYRKLAMRFHPDRNPDDPEAEERFKEATEAYSVLSDGEKRRRYDRFGHAAFESSGPGGFDPADFGSLGDVFESLLGEMFGRGRRRRGGRDLTYELGLDFVEAARGVEREITVARPMPCDVCRGDGAEPGTPVHDCGTCRGKGVVRVQRGIFSASRPCSACNGRGKTVETPCHGCKGKGRVTRDESLTVRIPAGVADGAVRTVRGAGEVAEGSAGDLHVQIRVEPHPLFERDGADIHCTVPVSFPQAALGAVVEVPTLDGKVNMKVPPGTQSGKALRLRGKGIDAYGGVGKGDQIVTIMVEVPERLTKKQKKLMEELAAEMGVETHPHQAGFLDKLRSLFE